MLIKPVLCQCLNPVFSFTTFKGFLTDGKTANFLNQKNDEGKLFVNTYFQTITIDNHTSNLNVNIYNTMNIHASFLICFFPLYDVHDANSSMYVSQLLQMLYHIITTYLYATIELHSHYNNIINVIEGIIILIPPYANSKAGKN